jgi:cardiolipin synthase
MLHEGDACMSLPNQITVARFCLIPIYLVVFFLVSKQLSFVVILLAGMTDVLDGYIARKFQLQTQTGELLDPLADKAVIVTVLVSFMIDGQINLLIGLLACLRELCMVAIGIIFYVRGIREMPANGLGKITTVLYYVLFGIIIFGWIETILLNSFMLTLLVILIVASMHYAWLALQKTKRHIRT